MRRLDGLLQGDYRTIFKGQGLDLADIREYAFGDDVRHIDWNVTARLDTPYVREYLEDREINAHFLLDLSPSVDFGTVDRRKRDLLIDFTGLLARLLTRHGNRVGATLYGSRVDRSIPARGGRVQVLRILNELEKRPRLESSPLTSLSDLLDSGMRGLKRRSLVFVVSDFFSAAGWESRLERIARLATLAEQVWESPGDAQTFLTTPHPQLDNQAPLDLAATDLGTRRVETLLWKLEHSLPV